MIDYGCFDVSVWMGTYPFWLLGILGSIKLLLMMILIESLGCIDNVLLLLLLAIFRRARLKEEVVNDHLSLLWTLRATNYVRSCSCIRIYVC